jgi:hypothetical protein
VLMVVWGVRVFLASVRKDALICSETKKLEVCEIAFVCLKVRLCCCVLEGRKRASKRRKTQAI